MGHWIRRASNISSSNPDAPTMLSVSDADVRRFSLSRSFTQDQKLPLIPPETGDYEQLYFDASKVKGYDDVQAYLKTGEVPKDIIDLQNTKS
jgi:hypothetical protein